MFHIFSPCRSKLQLNKPVLFSFVPWNFQGMRLILGSPASVSWKLDFSSRLKISSRIQLLQLLCWWGRMAILCHAHCRYMVTHVKISLNIYKQMPEKKLVGFENNEVMGMLLDATPCMQPKALLITNHFLCKSNSTRGCTSSTDVGQKIFYFFISSKFAQKSFVG